VTANRRGKERERERQTKLWISYTDGKDGELKTFSHSERHVSVIMQIPSLSGVMVYFPREVVCDKGRDF
jgi:hypothetical protein